MAEDGDDELKRIQADLARVEAEELRLLEEKARLKDEIALIAERRMRSPARKELNGLPLFSKNDADLRRLANYRSTPDEKIDVFLTLFAGRPDVYAKRWESAKGSGYSPDCANFWKKGCQIKEKTGNCQGCPQRDYIPFDGMTVDSHLRGEKPGSDGRDFVAGAYPLLEDDTCRFIVADFDKADYVKDAEAFKSECREAGIPVHLERSRSGKGCHAWVFFTHPVPARHARRMMLATLTKTMERRPDIGFDSYDRLIPLQDTMPKGGLGNLVALPLQRRPRDRDNAVFVDDSWLAHPDQWAYLSAAERMRPDDVERLSNAGTGAGTVLGIQMAISEENSDEPWTMKPSRPITVPSRVGLAGSTIKMTLGDQVYINRDGLPSQALAQFARIGAFQNPKFYSLQALGKSVWNVPRVISAAEIFPAHIALPRGCLDNALALAEQYGATVDLTDVRYEGTELPTSVKFKGELRPRQVAALEKLLPHDIGVIKAPPGQGKTVIGIAAIERRRRNALVIVFTKVVLHQWKKGLKEHLDIDPEMIGWIGDGKFKPTGIIDVALIHSLKKKRPDEETQYDPVMMNYVSDIVGNYGQVIVDEVHHAPAETFEPVIRRARARYHLAASATPKRSDGRHPLITMNFGPIRYHIDSKRVIAESGIAHIYRQRRTAFSLPADLSEALRNGEASPQELYRALSEDADRNYMIFDDVLRAMDRGRCPVVLSTRRDHIDDLYERFKPFAKNVIVLRGAMKAKEKRLAEELLAKPADEERLILATSQFLGEGFDDERLDSLFLTMPTSWEGLLEQYAGRLQRQHSSKYSVEVTDYVDDDERSQNKAEARRKIFKKIGFTIGETEKNAPYAES
ncbi:DEAD/DEAH box helicase family protein [Rhizobium laguerreae]|nr:DEAD/DEAH box helicase family protein [Rhizobium laguerreae]